MVWAECHARILTDTVPGRAVAVCVVASVPGEFEDIHDYIDDLSWNPGAVDRKKNVSVVSHMVRMRSVQLVGVPHMAAVHYAAHENLPLVLGYNDISAVAVRISGADKMTMSSADLNNTL